MIVEGEHSHEKDMVVSMQVGRLSSIHLDRRLHWPVCYHCWIPFDPPCSHPPIVKNQTIVCPFEEKCPKLLKHLVAHAYVHLQAHEPDIHHIAASLGVTEITIRQNQGFYKWIAIVNNDGVDPPNALRFLIAWLRRCRPDLLS